MPKARLYFDGDNSGIEKEARIYSLTQEVEDKLDSISNFQDEIDGLQDQINNLASRGRYLSTWDCVTGLPGTDPQVDPYVYRAGDYYIVSNVGGTNLRPSGAEYHVQVPSQVVESQSVSQNDLYIYDGIQWVLQGSGSSLLAVWGSITGTLSAQTDLQNALDAKANKTDVLEKTNTTSYTPTADYHPATKKYADDNDTFIGATAPTNNVIEGRLWYDTTADVLKVYNGSQWVPTGKTYTAGSHIEISNADVISTTGLQEELTAGDNITIREVQSYAAMQGPCDSGFHIPMKSEWDGVLTILNGLHITGQALLESLHIPKPGRRINYNGSVAEQSAYGYYWSSTANSGNNQKAYLFSYMGGAYTSSLERAYGLSIRPFKDSFVVPTASWTIIDGTLGGAGIFWNTTDGLISVTSDGSTGYTLSDKNLGATVVWSSGDTLSESNCGYYYQWGNNYGFPYTGSITTSTTRVDASDYGPGNYYSSSTFIRQTNAWDTSDNDNLWGGITGIVNMNIISATDTTYTAGTGINIDSNNVISTTVTPGQTYTAGNGINIDQNNEISVDTTVVATQTDLQNGLDEKQDELTAGDNITIGDICTTESDMKGPCPSGFHVPLSSEWQAVYDVWTALGGGVDDGDNFGIALKIPKPGYRFSDWGSVISQGTYGYYWSSSRNGKDRAYTIYVHSSILNPQYTQYRANGLSVRCFSNSPVIPTSTWTKLYGTSIENGGIFWSATDGLISLSSDGTAWITIADKNLGATTVWNSGDAFTEANCGKFYQWGNNYGFPLTGTVTTSSTQVGASTYGPGNYYSSDTFITGDSWDSSNNRNLRGGESQGTFQDCIHNVISATDTTYTAGSGLNLSNGEFSVDTTTIATKADIANLGTFVVVDTLPAASSADEKTIYLLGPIGSGADKYEEWIITRGAGNWASTTTMYPFTVNKNAWDGAIFIDSQTSPLSDFRGDCYVGAKLTSISDETKLPVKLSFRASSSVDSEWVGLNEPAFAYNPDQYPNGDDLDIYIPNTSSSNSVSITAEGVMSSSPITWELGPKQWTKIGETSVDLTNYLNTSTQTSDVITEGSTNLFLTSAERTKIANSITGMTILSYGNSTWQDFIDAYSNNRVVYCRASSNSDPSTGSQGRLAFMAYVNNASNPTEVEFQYYRSRSSHSTAANVLDEVYVYKLVPASGGTWTVTQRDTAAKPIAGTGIGLTYNASGMTISADTTTLATKTDLNSKQDTLVSGTNVKTINNESLLGSGNITISAPTYTAGDNVQISPSNVISATDTKYNAGEGISIGNVTKNGRQGPSPKGFHVPSTTEWQGVKTIMDGLSLTDGNDWKTNLHMPYAGIRVYDDAAINFQGNGGYYWASTPHETSAGNRLSIGSGFARTDGYDWRSNANSIRSFKDSYETPDSNWTVIQGTLGSAGIFWNQSEGLISITDGTTGYTIMDKNLGATVVYNNGNTLSQANMGNLYQWGNNYGFPSTGTITNTSSTQVDASGYGPTNPYSSETYIIGSTDWSSVQNDDLWGDTTGTYTQENVISNTVINSIQSSGPINVKKIWAGTTAQYNALSTYDADTIYIKVD